MVPDSQAAEAAELAAQATAAEVEAEMYQLQDNLPAAMEAIRRSARCTCAAVLHLVELINMSSFSVEHVHGLLCFGIALYTIHSQPIAKQCTATIGIDKWQH